MSFVTGVPHNAKIKAASFGRFELDPSSSRPTFWGRLCFVPRKFTYPGPIYPILVRPITRCDCASEAITSYSADLFANPVFLLDTCQSYLTFVHCIAVFWSLKNDPIPSKNREPKFTGFELNRPKLLLKVIRGIIIIRCFQTNKM